MKEKQLTPQQKLELIRGLMMPKNVKKYAAEVGVDRSYLYQLRREMEQAVLDTWSQKAVGRPPEPAPDPKLAELQAKIEQLDEESKVWEFRARVGECILEALQNAGVVKKTPSDRPI